MNYERQFDSYNQLRVGQTPAAIIVPMRRILSLIVLLSLLLTACQAVTVAMNAIPPTATTTATLTATPSPTLPIVTPSPRRLPLPNSPLTVYLHPDDGLYVGDQVSFEVIAPQGVDMSGRSAQVSVKGPQETPLGVAKFEGYGIEGREEATLYWAWNTSQLAAGDYTLTYSIQPDGPTWTQTVILQPVSALPTSEQGAHWASAQNGCCVIHYITGTAAERDQAQILNMAQKQAQDVSQKMHANFKEPIQIDLIPRVLGQGGFTSQEIAVSYLDQNYAGGNPEIVLHHEMVHLLDGQLGGELRPTILVEGLAVYLSGGHYKPEPLMERAAALLDMGWYLPLAPLTNNFYSAQHEVSYLEAGALIEYMVDRWGWDAFNQFYRDIHPDPHGGGDLAALNTALLKHFNLGLVELENNFLATLQDLPYDPKWQEDVRLEVRFYDTVRRYQHLLDPSAYYATAWLPDPKTMRDRGITADFLRHPSEPENTAIETLLVAANGHLLEGDYPEVERLLDMANAAMDEIEK
jgi:hypothetical protein